ncbi:50S ribosomal protein L32 [Tamaricihabitans halophyticus]|uniref:50S ribosomal protein L32 n=1 Tax=Tamaricihabitans halophyticus TaxID=1262583 RepID=UPI0010529E7C|nr:50S ribosomal protein L32 [Tamaricihabitans halophyticus]
MASSGFRRKSRANTRARRSQWKAVAPRLTPCPNRSCRKLKPRQIACPGCGQYNGRQVLPLSSS